MKLFKRLLLLFTFLCAAAFLWFSGLEFHPAFLEDYMRGDPKGPFLKLDLSDGYFVVGSVVSETPEAVRLKMGNGELDFERSRIRHAEPVEQWEVDSGKYDDWIIRRPKRPLLTKANRLKQIMEWFEHKTGIRMKQVSEETAKFKRDAQRSLQQLKQLQL